ncbi:MAG: regulatory protein RecX [Steroidobacteraceae bacterium]
MATRRGRRQIEADSPAAAEHAAVAMLARRDLSMADLGRRLRRRGYHPAAIQQALEQLGGRGLLDDARFAANFVAYQTRRAQGPNKIRKLLQESGVSSDIIDAALDGAGAGDFAEQAARLRERRFGPQLPNDWREKGRQARYLAARGFSNNQIRAVLGARDLPED